MICALYITVSVKLSLTLVVCRVLQKRPWQISHIIALYMKKSLSSCSGHHTHPMARLKSSKLSPWSVVWLNHMWT